MLKPFCAETQIQIKHEKRARMDKNKRIPDACFKNLK
jgi:hypothetical protein